MATVVGCHLAGLSAVSAELALPFDLKRKKMLSNEQIKVLVC